MRIQTVIDYWNRNVRVPIDHVAPGHFDVAEDVPDALSAFGTMLRYFRRNEVAVAFVDTGTDYVWRVSVGPE